MKKYSYVLLGDPMIIEGNTQKDPMLSGLWLWHRSFDKYGKKGDMRLIRRKEDFEEYDIVHVNMTSGNFALPQRIREELKNSSTKFIMNVDFDVGSFGRNFSYPTILEKQLQYADLVFHVEPYGANILEYLLQKHVPAIPHPVDVDGLDGYKKEEREPIIVDVFHRYYPDITTPYWVIRDLPLRSVLLGYMTKKLNTPALPMYDQYFGYVPFLEAMEIMSKAAFGLDLFHGYHYGRMVVEFAALAVPCVCSKTIDACNRLFPDLSVNPFDLKKANELFKKMIKDEEFHENIFKKAYYEAGYYSQKNSYLRMCKALEEIP